MFSHTYEPRYGDFKDFNTLKTGMLLDVIQDIAIRDSAQSGYDLNKLHKNNLAWLLQGIQVTLLSPADNRYPIEASTAVKTLKGVTSQRGCILSQNGKPVAHSIANWFLFNTQTARIARIPEEMLSAYTFYDFPEEDFTYQKLSPRQEISPLYTVRVSNKDIDTNLHLNNQRSADMLTDALPFDFFYTRMNILYKKQAYLNDTLEVCMTETDHGYYVHLQNKEKEVCVCGTFETA